MDFYTSLGFTIIIAALQDKGKAKAIRRAMLKVFTLTIERFGHDPEFRAKMVESVNSEE